MIDELREKCAENGFDLCDPIHTRWYNDLIEEEGLVEKGSLRKIPEPSTISDRDADGAEFLYNAALIGNSRSVWPKFISWLSSQCRERLEKNGDDRCTDEEILNKLLTTDPFDTFVTSTISEVLESCYSDHNCGIASQLESYDIFWSDGVHHKVDFMRHSGNDEEYAKNPNETHRCFVSHREESSFLVCMQRVAIVTGKYWHDDEGSKLCVHPEYGTWKAFRAVVVFHRVPKENDTHLSVPANPPICQCPVAAEELQRAKELMEIALKMFSEHEEGNDNGYGGDSTGKKDLCQYLHKAVSRGSDWSKVSPSMRPWIQLRDCFSVGRDDHKYSDNQLLYHCTKDTDILKKELNLL